MPEAKFKRKKFFINKRLQIRYMVSLLIPMLILIVFIGLVMYYSQYRFLQATTKEMSKDLKNIITTNQMYVEDEFQRNSKSVLEIRERLNQYMVGDRSFSGSLLKTAYRILFIGLLVVIIELAFLTIFISHKIAGPVYRFQKFTEEMRQGIYTTKIYLRRGDELTDLATGFNETGDHVCATVRRLMELNELAITMLKDGKADQDGLVRLEREMGMLRKTIKVS